MHDNATADPDHRSGPDDRQGLEEERHANHEATTDAAQQAAEDRFRLVARQRDADVVGLHDDRDAAIDDGGDPDTDECENGNLSPEAADLEAGQGDRHDFGGENEVGLDGTGDLAVLQRLRVHGLADFFLVSVGLVREQGLIDLLRPLIGEIEPAEHEQRGDGPWSEIAERQGDRQQEDQLVLQRTDGDLANDRQFALCGETCDVARRDRRVVDDDARGLGAGLGRLTRHVIQRGCSHLGQTRKVIEQRDQSNTHVIRLIAESISKRVKPIGRGAKPQSWRACWKVPVAAFRLARRPSVPALADDLDLFLLVTPVHGHASLEFRGLVGPVADDADDEIDVDPRFAG